MVAITGAASYAACHYTRKGCLVSSIGVLTMCLSAAIGARGTFRPRAEPAGRNGPAYHAGLSRRSQRRRMEVSACIQLWKLAQQPFGMVSDLGDACPVTILVAVKVGRTGVVSEFPYCQSRL